MGGSVGSFLGFRKPSANSASGMTPVARRGAHHPIAVRAQHLPFGIVDLLQIGAVPDILGSRGSRDHLVISGHDDDGSKLRSIGEVKGANCYGANFDIDLVAHAEEKSAYHLGPNSGKPQCGSRTNEAACSCGEYPWLGWQLTDSCHPDRRTK